MSNRKDSIMRKIAIFFIIAFTSGMTNTHADETNSQDLSYAAENYLRLKAELPYYLDAVNHPNKYPWPIIPVSRRILHQGSKGHAVLILRQRLKTTHDLNPEVEDKSVFDKQLTRAVKIFQWRHGLKPDGFVGKDTRDALNISPAIRAKQIQINMDRWARIAREMGNRFVLVNIPEYQLHIIENNQSTLSMKIIVGKPTRQTPELSSEITRIAFKPYWNVPTKIARRDIIPKILHDSGYLSENRIRIFSSQDEGAYELPSYKVNWRAALRNGFPYHFRQEPGIKNALGLVKFEFENTHNVYLHDTPAKELFNKEVRDFSSGCIRLEKPFALVAYLAKDDSRLDSDKLRQLLVKRKTSYFRVRDPLPIYIAYLTTWVDKEGVVHFVNDVYHRDVGEAVEQEVEPEE